MVAWIGEAAGTALHSSAPMNKGYAGLARGRIVGKQLYMTGCLLLGLLAWPGWRAAACQRNREIDLEKAHQERQVQHGARIDVARNEHGAGNRVQPDRACTSRENDARSLGWLATGPAGLKQDSLAAFQQRSCAVAVCAIYSPGDQCRVFR